MMRVVEMLKGLFSGTGAMAFVFLSALTLRADMVSPTLLVACDGYQVSADCVTGTAVYFEDGTARTQMLVRYAAPKVSDVPEPGSVALVGMALATMMMWRRQRTLRRIELGPVQVKPQTLR